MLDYVALSSGPLPYLLKIVHTKFQIFESMVL